jgi:sec-independent protein translocase protein TatA
VLVLFGPQRLPELARGLGKGMRELRKATAEIQQQLSLIGEYADTDSKKRERPLNSRLPSAAEAYSEADSSDETAVDVAGQENQIVGTQPRGSRVHETEQGDIVEHTDEPRKENTITTET